MRARPKAVAQILIPLSPLAEQKRMGASHFCNKQLYLGMKYLYGKPFREFRDLKRLGVHYVIRTEIVPAKALLPV
jgi:hypothetical protein